MSDHSRSHVQFDIEICQCDLNIWHPKFPNFRSFSALPEPSLSPFDFLCSDSVCIDQGALDAALQFRQYDRHEMGLDEDYCLIMLMGNQFRSTWSHPMCYGRNSFQLDLCYALNPRERTAANRMTSRVTLIGKQLKSNAVWDIQCLTPENLAQHMMVAASVKKPNRIMPLLETD
jgi:hypothetical protein